ncbi:MAG: hypothetical protein HQM16_16920 [Deltaproteobacteria bacterium]|nr:hypothetical protein [Deltaproteobacteria bacterium]
MSLREYAKILGRKGGLARGKRLSAAQRKNIASSGGKARSESYKLARRIENNFRYVDSINELASK